MLDYIYACYEIVLSDLKGACNEIVLSDFEGGWRAVQKSFTRKIPV